MRSLSAISMVACVAGMVAAANAQSVPRLTQKAKPKVEQIQRIAPARQSWLMERYFSCILENEPAQAAAFLAKPFGGPDFLESAKGLSSPECLTSDLRKEGLVAKYDPGTLRNGLFVATYKKQYATSASFDFAKSKEFVPNVDPAAKNFAGRTKNLKVAECIAKTDWPTTHELLIAERGSSREQDLLKKISPAIIACRDGQVPASLNPSVLLGQLAEASVSIRGAAEPSTDGSAV